MSIQVLQKKVKYVGTLAEFVSINGTPKARELLRVPNSTLVDNLKAKRDHLVMLVDGAHTLLAVKSAPVEAA